MTTVRVALFFAVLCLVILFGAPAQIVLRRLRLHGPAGRLQVAASRVLCRALALRVDVHGRFAPDGPTLVLANHVSWTDILVLGSRAPLCFVAKSDVAGWPALGWAIQAHGTLFVPRKRTREMAAVNARIAQKLADGHAVVLFPEGTTGNGSHLEPFRSSHLGAAECLLATTPDMSEVTLLPAALAYTRCGSLPTSRADRTALAWFGDLPLLPHVRAFVAARPVCCDLVWGDPLPFRRGGDRKSATAAIQACVRRDFTALVRGRGLRRENSVIPRSPGL